MSADRLGRSLLSSGTMALAVALASCLVFTGGTNGYDLADTGASGPSCENDASCSGLTWECSSSAACPSDAGTQICCLTPTSASGAIVACSSQPCSGPFGAQLCATDAECGGQSCVNQQCTVGGESITF